MSRLWSNWLLVWCWGVMAFGALLMTAAIPALDGLLRQLFALFAPDPASANMFDQPAVRFGLGLQGALTLGWALSMRALMDAAKTTGAPAWRALTVSLLAWYILDNAISIATGFWLNALSNTALMIAFAVPLLASGALSERKAKICNAGS